jgi:hypothetical protein
MSSRAKAGDMMVQAAVIIGLPKDIIKLSKCACVSISARRARQKSPNDFNSFYQKLVVSGVELECQVLNR